MKNLEQLTVPLMGKDGMELLVFRPSEFGDRYSVTIDIPRGVAKRKKLVLPRRLFSKSFLGDLKA